MWAIHLWGSATETQKHPAWAAEEVRPMDTTGLSSQLDPLTDQRIIKTKPKTAATHVDERCNIKS